MKRKLIICSSLITLLLACFSFPIFADEVAQDSSTYYPSSSGIVLDSYFYDNYERLPYIESNLQRQSINTSIKFNSRYIFDIKLLDIDKNPYHTIFGVDDVVNDAVTNRFAIAYITQDGGNLRLGLYANNYYEYVNLNSPNIYDIYYDRNFYINGNQITEWEYIPFESDNYLYLFCLNDNGTIRFNSDYKLNSCYIYDPELNGEGGYLRYFYPAKSKSSGAIGLYDAVSKTFFVSGSAYPFVYPDGDPLQESINFDLGYFLQNSLTWIGQIFTAVINMPIVIIFMAIGLAGAMFRWGRRIVHF